MKIVTALACALYLLSTAAPAADAPAPARKALWEVGIGGGGAYVPDYPAASHSQLTGIALPYAIYRGRILRADEDGVRGRIAENDRLELSLGIDAAFSAKSKDNRERRGLPNLDYLFEFGPSLEYRLAGTRERGLTLLGQARAAYAVNLDRFDYAGIALEPQLVYENHRFLMPRLELSTGVGAKFGVDGLNDYYYAVAERYQTARRRAYDARDGFQQAAWSTRLFYPVSERLSVFAASQVFANDGSANVDSPLFVHRYDFAVGLGLAYSLFVSERRAED